MLPILNQGGGLRYHFRALRYRRTLWRPFRQAVAEWLDSVLPQRDPSVPTILVGPSGGHCLDTPWLRSRNLWAIDWDPLAPWFFRVNHPGVRVRWRRADIIEGGLEALLKEQPKATIVFCNFLGQASFCSPKAYPDFARRLPSLLEGRDWASFHDLYSGPSQPTRMEPLSTPKGRPEATVLGAHFYSKLLKIELNEHELPELPADPGRRYWAWPLTTGAFHIIEGFASSAKGPRPGPSRPDQSPRDEPASRTPSDPGH